MGTRACYLRCIRNPENRVSLPDEIAVIVGRNQQTGILDPRVSRTHLICTANYTQKEVLVKTVGKNFSGYNGYCLEKDKEYTFKHNDQLEIILDGHQYDIIFEDSENEEENEDQLSEPPMKKIKLDQPTAESGMRKGKWEHVDNNELLIYTAENCISKQVIAAFDIDGTIIKTKSGARFPKDMDDWTFNFPEVPKKLRELYDCDSKIVFFTNQRTLSKDSSKVKQFKVKVENIVSKLSVPVQVFIATGKSIYRKPLRGMWDALCTMKNDDIIVDMDESFLVGDAAGREKNWAPKKNKDHSLSDRLFALNIGIKFHTPEEYFLKSPTVKYQMPEFDPTKAVSTSYPDFECNEQEVILMVGVQGSGKSHFCKKILLPKGYVYINRDSLGAWQKCVKKLEECLQTKNSAVIDNTNGDKENRARYIAAAKKFGVKCRCFLMDVSHNQARHNNRFRELVDKSHVVVSDILLSSFKKKFQPPELSEGFDAIVKIPFVPDFNDPEQEKLYKSFLLES